MFNLIMPNSNSRTGIQHAEATAAGLTIEDDPNGRRLRDHSTREEASEFKEQQPSGAVAVAGHKLKKLKECGSSKKENPKIRF